MYRLTSPDELKEEANNYGDSNGQDHCRSRSFFSHSLAYSEFRHEFVLCVGRITLLITIHGEHFMAIFTTLSTVVWFYTGTLEIFATLVYVFTMRVVIYDILSMAIVPTPSTSILFCNLCYIVL